MRSSHMIAFMFPVAFGLILAGIPVALALLVTAFGFGYAIYGWNIGVQLQSRLLDVASNVLLAAIPLFVLMGAILERSGIAERMFVALRLWLGRLPGGLAVTTIMMCGIFAAASGVVGAVEVLVGFMAIPAMQKARYGNHVIAGTICAGGSLGTIIPPSVVVVIYASLASVSVGDMLAGIIVPGGLMIGLFLLFLLVFAWLNPDQMPTSGPERDIPLSEKIRITLSALLPCILLIGCVLGSIFVGVASPTEAAALGALGAILLSAVYGELTLELIRHAFAQTVRVSAAILFIIFAGIAFTSIFMISGGAELLAAIVRNLNLSGGGMVALFLAIIFMLGFVMDWTAVMLISVPIFVPMVAAAGIDLVWFGVLVCVTLQTSYLTPPMAPSIFYLRSIAPPSMSYRAMYLGVLPFIGMQLITAAIVGAVPWTATYLPTVMFRF
jgi:tripartite ATP-independent transporter DctM subunit